MANWIIRVAKSPVVNLPLVGSQGHAVIQFFQEDQAPAFGARVCTQ